MKIKAIIKFKYIYLATLTAITAAYSTTSVADVSEPIIKQMIARADELNSKCRGGSGDDPVTHVACYDRDKLHSELQKAGWCRGKPEQYGYEKKWERCSTQLNPKEHAAQPRSQTVNPSWVRMNPTTYLARFQALERPYLIATIQSGKVSVNLLDTSDEFCKTYKNTSLQSDGPFKVNDTLVKFQMACFGENKVFGPSTEEGKSFLTQSLLSGDTKIEVDGFPPLIFNKTDFESVRKELLKTESAL